MFKKFGKNDIFTADGRTEESVVLQDAFYSVNRKSENHYLSASASGSYFLSILDGNVNLPWSNKLLTIAYGMHSSSVLSSSTAAFAEKNKIYRLYAKTLLGNEKLKFNFNGQQQNELMFLSVARNQVKDGLKVGTISVGILNGLNDQQPTSSAAVLAYLGDSFKNNDDMYSFPGGTAGNLRYRPSGKAASAPTTNTVYGLVFYDHGTAILPPHMIWTTGSSNMFSGGSSYNDTLSGTNNELLNGLANKLADVSFSNISKPQVTFFACVAGKEEFNYSSNPSSKNANGEIIVNSGSLNMVRPTTYITQIALCNDLGQVMAVAKSTHPIKKDFSKKVKITARLIT